MTKSVINFKVDSDVKAEAQKIAKEIGVPLSGIINAQLKQLIRTRKVEFDSTSEMTPFLESIIDEVEKDRKTGRNVTKTNSLEEALTHLDTL